MADQTILSIASATQVQSAADLLLSGNILLLKLGRVYGFIFHPQIEGLAAKLNAIKGRTSSQHLSLICSYRQALKIIDRDRINPDFFGLGRALAGKALIRIPLDTRQSLPFLFNQEENSVQFLSLVDSLPLGLKRQNINNVKGGAFLHDFQQLLKKRGCPFISGTSGNIHGQPTCERLEDAVKLSQIFNDRAIELGFSDIKAVVVDIPNLGDANQGSYPIVSFANPSEVEVVRLIGNDLALTRDFLEAMVRGVKMRTTITYPA